MYVAEPYSIKARHFHFHFHFSLSHFLHALIKTLEPSSYIGAAFAMGNMEEQSGHENPLQLMSFSFGGSINDASYVPKDDPSHHFTRGSGKNENPPNALYLSQWIHGQPTSHNYVKFLEESSTFPHKAPAKDIVDAIPLPENLSVPVLNNHHEASTSAAGFLCSSQNEVTYLNPQNGGQVNKFTSTQYQICTQDCTSRTQELNEDNFNVSKHNSRVAIAPPCFQSKPRSSASRQRASATDRRRRLRISERLKALQVLLPHSEGGKASVLDDIIDYIKHLQLQIKDLSQSRLGGQSTSDPFIFLEGYGHYILHDQMLKEPLEEMMGKLLEVNPSEATQLLEGRGLYVMPMTLVEGLLQTM
ncbi:transcription factor bHLH69-like isoform X4 [Vitis riparia]|uniref:transcription factor bHLH69-like isoform X4 n=1 Tax=Vitis riparia TaxID=96939 RepID=UPI00155A8C5A|nr:transcription factor bHLH69-like isoform X4 [Vitis riparia]